MHNFIQYIPTIVLILALAYREWRSGSKQVSTEVMTNYKLLDEQQKDRIQQQQNDIASIRAAMAAMKEGFIKEIAELRGQLQEKDRQLTDLQTILANRNPELESLMTEIRDFLKNIYDMNEHQTSILEAGQVRNQTIDEHTAAESGNVMRK